MDHLKRATSKVVSTFITSFTLENYHISSMISTGRRAAILLFWHTIKRCQTWFILQCFGSACQRIKHYLKEASFKQRTPLARPHDGAGAQWPRGMWVTEEHNRTGNTIRRTREGGEAPACLLFTLLGIQRLRHRLDVGVPQHRYHIHQVLQYSWAGVQTPCLSQWRDREAPTGKSSRQPACQQVKSET